MSSYQRHYDDSFLDGLHNYLPEVLYGDPEQFGGAAPLVSYVQRQMQQKFDLFSAGRRSFTTTAAPVTPPRRMPQQAPPPVQRRSADLTSVLFSSLYQPAPTYSVESILHAMLHPPQQVAMEPVIVAPTAEEIEAGSRMEIIDAEQEICTVCQDSMPAGSQARVLRCEHRFHTGCIDTWLARNVRCPTCRHDIREPIAE